MSSEATPLPVKLQQALKLHEAGQLTQARALYEEILRIQPAHSDAINLLGAISIQAKDLHNAVELFGRAIEIDPNNMAAYCNRGLAFAELGRFEAALTSYDKAIALRGDVAENYFNRGRVLRELRQLEAALDSYDRAIEIAGDYGQAHLHRSVVLRELKHWDAALDGCNRAIALEPDCAQAQCNRGNIFYDLKQWDAALASYDQAIALQADFGEAHCNRGLLMYELKQWNTALVSLERAIALKSDYTKAHFNRGNVLYQLKQWEAALASFDQAIALKPDYAEAYCNRGLALFEIGQLYSALTSYDQAIALKADFAQAYCNRGLVLHQLRQCKAALVSYDQAIALKPDYAVVYYNRALTYLLLGELEKGWVGYERRWDSLFSDSTAKRDFAQPRWLGGSSVAGKTVLLYWEQGLGDTLQFCRYARLVHDLGARVILNVQEPLKNLLTGLQGVSQIVSRGESLPAFDYHCPLLSLPLVFKTQLKTIPSEARYLNSDSKKVAQWQARLGQKRQIRAGLVWSGGAQHKNDRNRSVLLAQLIEHLPAGLKYMSLQKEVREADGQTLQSHPEILQFCEELSDLSDTAALCECLDVVISVDTSVAHLSAALGKPTWILLPFVPDWRWLLEREDTPWYPSVRLYRQTRTGNWDDVFPRIRSDLLKLMGSMPS